mmetsp:Transcript_108217/g.338649  ORF Transcript_108217/g.338649 Transcript_108217/m.338649 type:complete len:284 (+) Transcript_108217:858-1709(+)
MVCVEHLAYLHRHWRAMVLRSHDQAVAALAEHIGRELDLIVVYVPVLLAADLDELCKRVARRLLEDPARWCRLRARLVACAHGDTSFVLRAKLILDLREPQLGACLHLPLADDLAEAFPLEVFNGSPTNDRTSCDSLKEDKSAPHMAVVPRPHGERKEEVHWPHQHLQGQEADPPDGQGQVAGDHEDGEHKHWPRVRKNPNATIHLSPARDRVDAEDLARVPRVDEELQRGDEEHRDNDNDLPHGWFDCPPDRRNLFAKCDHGGDGATHNRCTTVQNPDRPGC